MTYVDSIVQKISKRWIVVGVSVVCAMICGFLVTRIYREEIHQTLRLSAGPSSTKRFEIASYFCEQVSKAGLTLNLEPTPGSVECIELLKSGQLDIAFINNCISVADDDDVQVLGVVGIEPFHVLVRGDFSGQERLGEWLKGKRVGVGEKGSTEWLFAHEALAYERLKLPTASNSGDVTPVEYKKIDLLSFLSSITTAEDSEKESLINKLPECMLVQGSLPSIVVQSLVEKANYKIVPIAATEAFLNDTFTSKNHGTAKIERQFLEATTIPMLTYLGHADGQWRIPESDCKTLGARLIVVAHRDVPNHTIELLMKTLFEGEFQSRTRPISPRDIPSPFNIHDGAVAYLDRDKPVVVNEVMEGVNKALSILGAMSAGGLSIYGLFWKSKSRKPTDYFAELRKLELLYHSQSASSSDLETREGILRSIEHRLITLRHELIDDICEGRITNEQSISTIITILQDYRHSTPQRITSNQGEDLSLETRKLLAA
jgi:TRAP-type uncharacterized transport system substrate-binding protein